MAAGAGPGAGLAGAGEGWRKSLGGPAVDRTEQNRKAPSPSAALLLPFALLPLPPGPDQ